MEQIAIRNLTFSYDGTDEQSLIDVSFEVKKGSFALLIGESGCGKTTLLKNLKSSFMPSGKRKGDVFFEGVSLDKMDERQQAAKIGFVRQNVEGAQVTDKVWHELAFGLESLGYPQEVMQKKVAELSAFFGLDHVFYHSVDTLSGGQKQLVNLASVMAMEPEIIILDEPTSQLDPIAAGDFFNIVKKINRELGVTVLMTEHRLEEAYPLCSQVIVMEKGRVCFSGEPRQSVRFLFEKKSSMYLAMPTAARIYLELSDKEQNGLQKEDSRLEKKLPLDVGEGSGWFEDFCEEKGKMHFQVDSVSDMVHRDIHQENALQAEELWFRYERQGKDVLKACSISLKTGTVTALLGGNGTGKSTLLHVLSGHLKAYNGKVSYGEKESNLHIGMLFQNPQVMFAKKTVEEELRISMPAGYNSEEKEKYLNDIVKRFGFKHLLGKHPFDLSGGEMQKLALAKLVLEDADILLLDEPGKGMDYAFKEEMGALLRELAKSGKTILLVSHDVEFCARFADQCGLFFDGHIISLEESRNFFCQNVFYTTATRRICRECMKEAVVMEDVLLAFGEKTLEVRSEEENAILSEERMTAGETEERVAAEGDVTFGDTEERIIYKGEMIAQEVKETKKMKHGFMTFLIFFLLMPATIYVGEVFLHQRKYYFISLLLVLEAIASFFFSFERRKPKIREIMVVATLCAITVAGRAAFYMVPNVKPMAALVILSGVSLGGEIGFLVGAFSMLVSNIFFGQGPWTPWQMFAMGILGFLAGVIFRKDMPLTRKKIIGLCVFGFLSVVIFYGGIMNLASVIMYQDNVNVEMIIAACGMGLPFDVIHGASTAVFLLIGAKPILEKLGRVKKKYGFDVENRVQ